MLRLKNICNDVLKTGNPHDRWSSNIIIPIPKKGNSTNMSNFRGISLMSIAAKVYNRILLNRPYPFINSKLRLNQAGFRKNMKTVLNKSLS